MSKGNLYEKKTSALIKWQQIWMDNYKKYRLKFIFEMNEIEDFFLRSTIIRGNVSKRHCILEVMYKGKEYSLGLQKVKTEYRPMGVTPKPFAFPGQKMTDEINRILETFPMIEAAKELSKIENKIINKNLTANYVGLKVKKISHDNSLLRITLENGQELTMFNKLKYDDLLGYRIGN